MTLRARKFESYLDNLINETITLNQIPAPTFEEAEKGRYIKSRFEQIGLQNIQLDSVGNILGLLPGEIQGNEVVIAAHLDTVFPAETNLKVTREEGRLIGPGTGDNNVAVAALLELAAYLKNSTLKLQKPVLFAATVGEEGLGDLRGIRALVQGFQAEKRQPAAVVAVEGHGLGNICYQGVGSRRMRVTVRGPGGHSWDKAGQPSAIHGLAFIMHRLTTVPVPVTPRTSFNIGTITGGMSVNTIAPVASMVFEVRSIDETALANTFGRMEEIIRDFQEPGLSVETEMVGDRPAGGISSGAEIVKLCEKVYRTLKIEPGYTCFSTDANIPLSLGWPAVCIGITRGGNAHRTDEWIEIAPTALGFQALVEITLGLAG